MILLRAMVGKTLDALRDEMNKALRAISDEFKRTSRADAKVIEGVALVEATDNDIAHGLGRAWKGWRIVDLTGCTTTGRIERRAATTIEIDTSKVLRLRATGWGATITVSVEVF